MEGLGDGYEAFVERLQMDIAASSATKSSNQASSHSGHPPHPSRAHQSRYTGYPSPTNAFTPMTEASPALSDSSTRMTGCMSVEVSMEDAVSSPGPPCVTGPMRMPSPAHHFSSDVNQMPDAPPRPRSHRRAQSEIAFRLPDELLFEEELRGAEGHPLLDDEAEELLSIYLDLEEKYTPGGLSNSALGAVNGNTKSLPPHHSRSLSVDRVFNGFDGRQGGSASISSRGPSDVPKPRHHHSNSMDGSLSIKQEFLTSDLDSFDTKKNMTADKLAELALIDPKRAKRILANRQSAARSKERKMRYISELERKVQTLQMEATTLSAQLTVLQRDSTGLTTENKELKLRLQSMEQQAQLRNALNDALKEEVQRLKLATGHLSTANGNAFKIGAEHPSLNQSFYQLQKPSQHHTSQQLQQGQSSLSNNQQGVQTQAHSDFIQHKSFGPL